MGDGAALIARIDAAERATLLSRQRVAELESAKKGAQLDLGKLSAANTQQQHVCRELQQAMKALGGGEGNAEDDEAARREELASKFDGTLGDIGDIGERMGEHMGTSRAIGHPCASARRSDDDPAAVSPPSGSSDNPHGRAGLAAVVG